MKINAYDGVEAILALEVMQLTQNKYRVLDDENILTFY
jgi:hypothetical protein